MKTSFAFLIICMAVLFSCATETGDAVPNAVITTVSSNLKALQLDTLYSELYESGAFNGCVLVAENGEVIFEKSYGLADEQTQRALNDSSIFELASVSKQFTAMGIVQLQKEGKLSFDDEISRYVPELARYQGVTIFNLLNHTSGLPDYMELAEEHWDKSKIATNDDILRLFGLQAPAPLFEPNAQWEYSNTGYLVLATIIERVSGRSFGDYLNDKIFTPLEMTNTLVHRRRFAPLEIENYAHGYVYSESLQKKILPDELGADHYVVWLDGIVGDGMVNSNLKDLFKWDRALYTNQLVDDADRDLLFSSVMTADSTQTEYGLGWMIDSTDTYGKSVLHTGGWAGYITFIERNLDHNHTIIVLQNNAHHDSEMPIEDTRRILFNQSLGKRGGLEESM
jgi:CubicO group peptidase (beta-lactamase class C family)